MGMTIAEKVIARAAGLSQVHPGQYVDAKIDRIIADEEFYRMHAEAVSAGIKGGIPRIWDKERFHVIIEHHEPPLHVVQALRQKKIREVVEDYGVKYFQDVTCGVIHQLVVEDYALPGELSLGSDSHSCAWGALNCVSTGMGEHELAYALCYGTMWFRVPETVKVVLEGKAPGWLCSKDIAFYLAQKYSAGFGLYKSIEFTGPGASEMSMSSRLTLSVHAIELGAKFGLFLYDDKTEEFLKKRKLMSHQLPWAKPVAPDPDAKYCQEVVIDLGSLEPLVAKPHTFENIAPVSEVAGTPIHQAQVGSCANGRLEDLEAVAEIMRGRKVHPKVRFYVQPASWKIYRECMDRGIIGDLLDAGVQILSPGCHLCLGMQGRLADGETCITSTTRNHRGRMGSGEADVYLANPQTVAASAIAGCIADFREVTGNRG